MIWKQVKGKQMHVHWLKYSSTDRDQLLCLSTTQIYGAMDLEKRKNSPGQNYRETQNLRDRKIWSGRRIISKKVKREISFIKDQLNQFISVQQNSRKLTHKQNHSILQYRNYIPFSMLTISEGGRCKEHIDQNWQVNCEICRSIFSRPDIPIVIKKRAI